MRAAELIRDFASTAHVALCLVNLLDTKIQGAFDIGSGQSRRLGELARIVANAPDTPTLIHLSHKPNPDDPPHMAPELRRVFQSTTFAPEMPEVALLSHVQRELTALRNVENS